MYNGFHNFTGRTCQRNWTIVTDGITVTFLKRGMIVGVSQGAGSSERSKIVVKMIESGMES